MRYAPGVFILLALSVSLSLCQKSAHTFSIRDNAFMLDGRPFQIICGEMHFARIPAEYWRDRLQMAKAMGLNTIATYVFWNVHEPEKGKYNFQGNADVAAFVKTAQEVGLWVIVRPSPYACAEWEFGGYPWWLLNEEGLKVRSRDEKFLEMSRRYFRQLGKELAPLQITRGGPIIMVQLENEYGSYDKDKEYLTINKNIIRESGFDVELYTCDGPSQMPNGYLPGLLPAVNGLDDVKEVRELINKHHNGQGPYFIAEWYPAWFDSWGIEHHVVPAEEYGPTLDTVLASGTSISMYMVHGGTTRGFMNGANMDRRSPYSPQVSSYDYDAPIDEAGNATAKYLAFRSIIRKHLPAGVVVPEVPPREKTIALAPVKLGMAWDVLRSPGRPTVSPRPRSFEDIGQGYGYVLYRTEVRGPRRGMLAIKELRDYALIYLDGKRIAVLDRRLRQDSVALEIPGGTATLDIFVENLGRINYGPYLNDNRKGITEKVLLGGEELTGWKIYGFPFTDFSGVTFQAKGSVGGPALRRGTFTLSDTGDTYLDMREFGKGCVWVNGRSIGRYWNIGPQQTLYVPGPWLRKGENEILVFEMLCPAKDEIRGIEHPILDELNNPKVTVRSSYDSAKGMCLVTFSCKDSAASIYYTTDGSEPTSGSSVYTGSALPVAKTATLAARGFRNGVWSDAVTRVEVAPSLSTGKKLTLYTQFSQRYPAGGIGALVDGLKGSENFRDGFWQGYEGEGLEAVLDLGEEQSLNSVRMGFLQDIGSWIFLPSRVEYSVSSDRVHYTSLGVVPGGEPLTKEGAFFKEFSLKIPGTRGRYLKVNVESIGVCPPGHPGAGGKAWIFADEVVVE